MNFDPNYTRFLASAIDRSMASEQTLTSELASGFRVNQLSDDPAAVASNVRLSSSISRMDSFVKSSTEQESQMQVADNALGEVVTQVTSAISLATSAGNGTLSAADFTSIGRQLAGIRDTVLSLANTSYAGTFVFAGSNGGSKPFALDTSTDPAIATYGGDAHVNTLTTPDGQLVPTNLPGSTVFQSSGADLLGTLNQLVSTLAAAASGNASTSAIQAGSSALSSALAAVSGGRATLDSALSRMNSATTYASTQRAVYAASQTSLLSADPASVATDLKTAETQSSALLAVTGTLQSAPTLFSYLK